MDRKNMLGRLQSYPVREYILRLFGVVVIMFFCFTMLGRNSSPLVGFIFSSAVFFLITIAATFILLRDSKWILFFSISYLIHLGIGTLHYLYFIDPSYFSSNGQNLPLANDFKAPLDAVKEIVLQKSFNGLLHYTDYYVGHPEIWNIISYPFYYFGAYILNIAPLNSFMIGFTSINLLLISKQFLRCGSSDLKKIAILSAYFPLTMISSIFYRDVSGIALISVGLVLIALSKGKVSRCLLLIISLYLFYLQRTIYPMVLLLAFMIDLAIRTEILASLGKRTVAFFCFIPFFILTLFLSYKLGLAEGNNATYIKQAVNVNYFFYPIKILMGLVGPFPWTQYFSTGRIVYSYQFADYFQGALNVSMFFVVINFRNCFIKLRKVNIINLTGFFLMASGLATMEQHSSYVSIGVLFLIPWFVVNLPSWHVLEKAYLRTFFSMLILSLIIFIFFGSLGVGNLWK